MDHTPFGLGILRVGFELGLPARIDLDLLLLIFLLHLNSTPRPGVTHSESDRSARAAVDHRLARRRGDGHADLSYVFSAAQLKSCILQYPYVPASSAPSHATIFVDWSLIHLASKTVNKINVTPACHNGVPQALHGTPFCRILRLRI